MSCTTNYKYTLFLDDLLPVLIPYTLFMYGLLQPNFKTPGFIDGLLGPNFITDHYGKTVFRNAGLYRASVTEKDFP